MSVVETLAVHCHCDVCSVAGGILQGAERTGSVCSIMLQGVTSNSVTVCAASVRQQATPTPTPTRCNTHNHDSNMKHQQPQLLWYTSCCFISPTPWQHLLTARTFSSLMCVHTCQHTAIIILHNL
jgi:hypothetical protein